MCSEFVDNLRDLFVSLQPLTSRRMFGGTGIFHQGLMFAMVIDDVLYLKSDSQSAELFEQHGCEPFTYMRQGKSVSLNYYTAPESIFDDLDDAREWSELAFTAALHQSSKATKKR